MRPQRAAGALGGEGLGLSRQCKSWPAGVSTKCSQPAPSLSCAAGRAALPFHCARRPDQPQHQCRGGQPHLRVSCFTVFCTVPGARPNFHASHCTPSLCAVHTHLARVCPNLRPSVVLMCSGCCPSQTRRKTSWVGPPTALRCQLSMRCASVELRGTHRAACLLCNPAAGGQRASEPPLRRPLPGPALDRGLDP